MLINNNALINNKVVYISFIPEHTMCGNTYAKPFRSSSFALFTDSVRVQGQPVITICVLIHIHTFKFSIQTLIFLESIYIICKKIVNFNQYRDTLYIFQYRLF